jgi:hypothetical protein
MTRHDRAESREQNLEKGWTSRFRGRLKLCLVVLVLKIASWEKARDKVQPSRPGIGRKESTADLREDDCTSLSPYSDIYTIFLLLMKWPAMTVL